MRIFFQLLGRRWWGVSGWGYLFSLSLAVLVYWLLPGSRAVHQWSFRGVAYIVGFVEQDRAMLVKQLGGDGCWYVLDLTSGAVQQYTDPESVRKSDLKQASRVPYVLFKTRKMLGEPSSKIELKDERTGKVRNISTNGKSDFVRITQGGFSMTGRTIYQTVELKTDGEVAMSMDERWLLLSESKDGTLTQFISWLRQKTGWNWPFVWDANYRQAIVVDLFTKETNCFVLSKHKNPRFEVHPQGDGFAVVDTSPQLVSIHHIGQDIGNTTIEWYSLPVRRGNHSAGEWGVIAGTFGASVLLSMVISLIWGGKQARVQVAAPLHP